MMLKRKKITAQAQWGATIMEVAMAPKVSHISLNTVMDPNLTINILNQISQEIDQGLVQALHLLLIHTLDHHPISILQRNCQLEMTASTVLASTWVTRSNRECPHWSKNNDLDSKCILKMLSYLHKLAVEPGSQKIKMSLKGTQLLLTQVTAIAMMRTQGVWIMTAMAMLTRTSLKINSHHQINHKHNNFKAQMTSHLTSLVFLELIRTSKASKNNRIF